jgi:endoribonuclease Nob1
MKRHVIILDTSAILSGKPIHFTDATLVTTPAISEELTPGGKDYQKFEFLKETGLTIHAPSKEALYEVKKTAQETGDDRRLSPADTEILALAIDLNKESDTDVAILTDDYSIQNVATVLGIHFLGFSQDVITQKFKWVSRCPGCGKQFNGPVDICPICGTKTRNLPRKKEDL